MTKGSTAVMVSAKNAINAMFVGISIHNERHTPKIDGPVVTALRDAGQALSEAIIKANAKPEVTKLSADDEIVSYLEGVIGCVEANSFEQHSLWKDNRDREKNGLLHREWNSTGHGLGETIGYVDERPVAISLKTVVIDGQKILLYYATSTVVDHDMIREWLKVNLPETAKGDYPGGYNHTDATNFHNVFRRK